MSDAVELHSAPWLPGMTGTYFGPVTATIFVPASEGLDAAAALDRILDDLSAQIRAKGGNAGMSADCHIDPWAYDQEGRPGLWLYAFCTATRLQPLFPDAIMQRVYGRPAMEDLAHPPV